MGLLEQLREERTERALDRLVREADQTPWLVELSQPDPTGEPCSSCEETDHDWLDPWGRCPTCVEAARLDAADGYDHAED